MTYNINIQECDRSDAQKICKWNCLQRSQQLLKRLHNEITVRSIWFRPTGENTFKATMPVNSQHDTGSAYSLERKIKQV